MTQNTVVENPGNKPSTLSESAKEVDVVLTKIIYPALYAADFIQLANTVIKNRMNKIMDAKLGEKAKSFIQELKGKINADANLTADKRIIAINWLNKFENGNLSA